MIKEPQVFFDEGDRAGGGTETAPAWQADYPFFGENPEAAKAFSKYKTDANEAFKGAYEAVKRYGEPYRLPKDPTKLSDEQKNEILASVAKMKGVPENPNGYNLTVPEGLKVDDRAMSEFKILCHNQGKSIPEAQAILDIHSGMVSRLNETRVGLIKQMTNDNHRQWVEENEKSEAAALTRENQIKNFLQSTCYTIDEQGQQVQSPEMWEAFQKRILCEDRIIELPLMRALSAAAQEFAQGGSPQGQPSQQAAAGALDYPEMRKK